MKVYFGACGIGLGHVGRCAPIAQRLQRQGHRILFSTYDEGYSYASSLGFPCRRAPSVGFVVKPDGAVDFRQTTVNPGPFIGSIKVLEQIAYELMVLRSFRPDLVVSDSRVSTILGAKTLGLPVITVLNQFKITIPATKRLVRLARLTDTGALALIGRVWTLSDRIMIPDFPLPYTISAGNLRIPKRYSKKVSLTGPFLEIRPQALPPQEELRKKLFPGSRKLIFAPISGPVKEKGYLIELLMTSLPQLADSYDVVLSLGNSGANSPPIVDKEHFKAYHWIEDRFSYLKACDLVLSRAGHGTISQAITYGKPLIIVPTPNHTEQMQNARRVEQMGLAVVLEQSHIAPRRLRSTVEQVIEDIGFTRRAQEAQKHLAGYDGISKVLDAIDRYAPSSA
ncbi:MAG: glycosyltransferase [Candidatus Bathyarchaeia archaeon]